MARSRTVLILDALAAGPAAWRYGYELGLQAGSLYPSPVRAAVHPRLREA